MLDDLSRSVASQSTAEMYAEHGWHHSDQWDAFLSDYDWLRLPRTLSDRVCREYCCSGWESEEYRAALRAAVEWIEANPQHEQGEQRR